jgi:hypothetical protein
MCFYFFLIPIDCFRDGSGMHALKIQKCLSEASFLNLAGRPETARLETIVGRILFGHFIFGRSK